MAPFEKQWEQCLAIIRENLQNEDAYQAFFASVRAGEFKDGRLTLLVPSHYVYETLESDQYYNLLSKTFWRVFGPNASIKYRIGVVKTSDDDVHDDNASVKLNPKNRIEAAPETNFESHLNPNCTLSAFCPGKSNELALSAGLTVSNRPGNSAFNPFFIFGASGVGKTHLAQAIGLKILENDPTKCVLYVTAYQFKVQYTDAVRQNRLNDFINFYQSIDVLIVDDIQEFAGKNLIATQNTFFHIFNHLHQHQKQLIMTSDCPPADLDGMVPRLISRFKWGITVKLDKPDLELRREVLAMRAAQDGLPIEQEVIDYIAANVTESVRELEGIVVSLLAHATMLDRDITVDLARSVIANSVHINKRQVTFEMIAEVVADHYNIDTDQLYGKSRKREISDARQLLMYFAKKETQLSSTNIGLRLARNHATVLHACKQIEQRLSVEKDFRNEVAEIEAAFH